MYFYTCNNCYVSLQAADSDRSILSLYMVYYRVRKRGQKLYQHDMGEAKWLEKEQF